MPGHLFGLVEYQYEAVAAAKKKKRKKEKLEMI